MKRRRKKNYLLTDILLAAAAVILTGCGAGGSGKQAMATMEAGQAYATDAAGSEVPAGEGLSWSDEEAAAAEDDFVWEGVGMSEPPNTERYREIVENAFLSAENEPISTFGADVDTASYANIRKRILRGEKVNPNSVRIEEMINYFSYDYPEPEGDAPFSVTTEIGDCPWQEGHQLLRIGLQAPKLDNDALPPSNLVFLLDVSGSMKSEDKLPLVKRAFLLLTENLKPEDRISIVTYASSDQILLEGASGRDMLNIMSTIESLEAFGSTNGSAGILTAYELAEKYFIPGGNNRVILATDGDFNVGMSSERELFHLIENQREKGVFLSVMGFGMGNIKDDNMEVLADSGNGNYAYIDDIAEARKVLIEEMGGTLFTVAKDVKIQVEFNPAIIKEYRLIGYENRLMAARDFDDDQKDGGELGAGHRVTALYELVPESGGDFDDPWLTVRLRYKAPDGEESTLLEYPAGQEQVQTELSADFSFAAGVAQTGMLLKGSEYSGTSTYQDVITRLKALPGITEDPYKEEFLYLLSKLNRSR